MSTTKKEQSKLEKQLQTRSLVKPTFAELWDICCHQHMYNPQAFTQEFAQLLKQQGFGTEAYIVDTSAGTGFPAIPLYQAGHHNIRCMDASDDEIAVFARNARAAQVPLSCEKQTWLAMQETIPADANVLLCRGNSFIYAAGGWNVDQQINIERSQEAYMATLRNFHHMLAKDGILVIDKFRDDEVPCKQKVTDLIVNGVQNELIFYTERMPETRTRKAMMLLRAPDGTETGTPNVTYLLTQPELRRMLYSTGFQSVENVQMENETHFDILIARK